MSATARAAAAFAGFLALAGAIHVASDPAAAQSGGLSIVAKPALRPRFDQDVHDYVSRCGGAVRLRLAVATPHGTKASVDGGTKRSGTFTTSTRLGSGQGLVVRARSSGRTEKYRVRCLPTGFPRWSAKRTGPTQAEWYLVTPLGGYSARWVVLFDGHGVPVWWRHTRGRPFNATLLHNGDLVWYRYFKSRFGVRWDTAYEQHRLDGSMVRTLAAVGVPTDFHELQELPNGNFLLDAYRPRHGVDLRPYGGPRNGTVYDAEVQEITPGGRLVWRWNSHGHIDLSETHRWWPRLIDIQSRQPKADRAYDVVHINSISADGDGLVISARHCDAVYRVDRATGRVEWKLGGTRTPESLAIAGDPEHGSTTFGGQHDVRVLPDGTITVHDNGTDRLRPPRDVRYAIDTNAGTATLLEQLTDPDVPSSQWGGSTRRLPGGDWVTAWGGEPYVTEMTPSGKRVFRLTLTKSSSYRVFPVPFGRLSAATLRAAMDGMHPRRRR